MIPAVSIGTPGMTIATIDGQLTYDSPQGGHEG